MSFFPLVYFHPHLLDSTPLFEQAYWKLPDNALWIDALKCMMADEAMHRDVNHTFAMMRDDDPNPFILKHRHDAARAWRLENEGREVWESKDVAIAFHPPPAKHASSLGKE